MPPLFLDKLRSETLVNFYRATICVGAVFAVVRCPSVCLSVTFMYCIQTAEDIVELLSRPGIVHCEKQCGPRGHTSVAKMLIHTSVALSATLVWLNLQPH